MRHSIGPCAAWGQCTDKQGVRLTFFRRVAMRVLCVHWLRSACRMINEIYLDMGAETKRCKGCQERMTQEIRVYMGSNNHNKGRGEQDGNAALAAIGTSIPPHGGKIVVETGKLNIKYHSFSSISFASYHCNHCHEIMKKDVGIDVMLGPSRLAQGIRHF
ncbi:hypothetical protein Naga_100787g2 [Nannochloropsis gaditana]|uniref:Uncharacterized protein n=1 Tax=Nannochloropsis gaditana TaxID=72520 RepID=W7T1A6_9STRA|nr:hypothetical protein Naga_100787g2 [Nannochloropsis gaditana]